MNENTIDGPEYVIFVQFTSHVSFTQHGDGVVGAGFYGQR